jgi:polysaccharide pyruvyl transferase WcaK-like protein
MLFGNKFKNDIKEKVVLIHPQLENYHEVLSNNDVDYVGTRLHGGIYAINQKKRAIIIGIDNRAIEMQKDINLNVISRDNIDDIECIINQELRTEIKIPQENIDRYLSQFVKKEY